MERRFAFGAPRRRRIRVRRGRVECGRLSLIPAPEPVPPPVEPASAGGQPSGHAEDGLGEEPVARQQGDHGRVKNQATMTSSTVERPRKKAKPRTGPTVSHLQHGGAEEGRVSAVRMVRNARLKPARPRRDGAAGLDLVLEPLEVHDVRVDRHADRHDDAGHAGQRQGQAPGLAELAMTVHSSAAQMPRPTITTRPRAR